MKKLSFNFYPTSDNDNAGHMIYGRVMMYGNMRQWKHGQFILWIDGVCYGVFSRVRDAMRKYRSLPTSVIWQIMPTNHVDAGEPYALPAWIENLDGKLVRSIVGLFPFAV